MRKYGKIETGFWQWARRENLSDDAKMIAAYLLTCPHGNMSGVFLLSLGYVQGDLKMDAERVSKGFQELQGDFLFYCEITEYVFLPDFINHNPPDNGNTGKALAKVIEGVPRKFSYWHDLINVLEPFSKRLPEGFIEHLRKGLVKGYPKGIATQEQEQEQEQDTPVRGDKSPDGNQEQTGTEPTDAALYRRGKEILGSNAGGIITKLRKRDGDEKSLKAIEWAATMADPMAWIVRHIEGEGPPDDNRPSWFNPKYHYMENGKAYRLKEPGTRAMPPY